MTCQIISFMSYYGAEHIYDMSLLAINLCTGVKVNQVIMSLVNIASLAWPSSSMITPWCVLKVTGGKQQSVLGWSHLTSFTCSFHLFGIVLMICTWKWFFLVFFFPTNFFLSLVAILIFGNSKIKFVCLLCFKKFSYTYKVPYLLKEWMNQWVNDESPLNSWFSLYRIEQISPVLQYVMIIFCYHADRTENLKWFSGLTINCKGLKYFGQSLIMAV